jgi:hypothetical protein
MEPSGASRVVARVTALPCFQHVRWDPDAAELRRFAWWMLGGFAVLGSVAAWQAGGVGVGAMTLWSVGVALAASTRVRGLGRASYLGVYVLSGVIGYVVSRVVLTAIFYLVFTPIGLVLKVTGHDLLQRRRRPAQTMWVPHAPRRDRESYYRQF